MKEYCNKCTHEEEEHSTFGSRCRKLGCKCVRKLSTGAIIK